MVTTHKQFNTGEVNEISRIHSDHYPISRQIQSSTIQVETKRTTGWSFFLLLWVLPQISFVLAINSDSKHEIAVVVIPGVLYGFLQYLCLVRPLW